jgi:hypothetical protein
VRTPTTKATPSFQVGDYVAFEPSLVTADAKEAGFMKLVFRITAFDQSILKYRAVNLVGEQASTVIYLAGSFFRPLTDTDLLRFRLTGSL